MRPELHGHRRDISTSGAQTYNDPVTLTGIISTLAFDQRRWAEAISFLSTLKGGFALSISTLGVITFEAASWGAVAPLASLYDPAGRPDRLQWRFRHHQRLPDLRRACALGRNHNPDSSNGDGDIDL